MLIIANTNITFKKVGQGRAKRTTAKSFLNLYIVDSNYLFPLCFVRYFYVLRVGDGATNKRTDTRTNRANHIEPFLNLYTSWTRPIFLLYFFLHSSGSEVGHRRINGQTDKHKDEQSKSHQTVPKFAYRGLVYFFFRPSFVRVRE